MSAWPISTRLLLNDNVLYFVAGYWPVDGIYVHAVDAATGRTLWRNDTAEFRPSRQITLVDGKLMIDGDNSSAVLDAKTGVLLKEKPVKPQPPERPNISGLKGNVTAWSQDGDLLAVGTTEGVFAFSTKIEEQAADASGKSVDLPPLASTQSDCFVSEMLGKAGFAGGYCLVIEANGGAVVESLLRKSQLHVVVVEPDIARADKLRRDLDERGLYDDHRLTVLAGPAEELGLPPYFATLIVADSDDALSESLRHCLRPYGGVLVVGRIGDPSSELRVTRRDGPPAGAADWTHEFRDAANSLASPDSLVKAPLGVLWYGGEPAHARFISMETSIINRATV